MSTEVEIVVGQVSACKGVRDEIFKIQYLYQRANRGVRNGCLNSLVKFSYDFFHLRAGAER